VARVTQRRRIRHDTTYDTTYDNTIHNTVIDTKGSVLDATPVLVRTTSSVVRIRSEPGGCDQVPA